MTFPEFYSNKTIETLINQSTRKTNQIFVLLGQSELVDKSKLINHITDIETFHLNGNEELFDKNWFTTVFGKNGQNDHHISV